MCRVTAYSAVGQIFTLVNFAVLPFWGLMIFSPKWQVTEQVCPMCLCARVFVSKALISQAKCRR